MRLVEFQGQSSRQPSVIAMELQSHLGRLVRVGGSRRVYLVNEGEQVAAVYVIDGTEKAFALAWAQDLKEVGVSTVYLWDKFSINDSADYELDIPITGDIHQVIGKIAEWIKSPQIGPITESVLSEATRVNDQEFIRMARELFGARANKMSIVDLNAVKDKYDVQIPMSIRSNPNLKVDAHHWNLSGGSNPADERPTEINGTPVEEPDQNIDPAYQDMLHLAKAKTLSKLAAAGKLYLYGKKSNGKFFTIPGLTEILAQLERMLSRQIADNGGAGEPSMEDQYEDMKDKVRLVAGGKSSFVKSLLITGAPSSGKTYVVMQTLKELGIGPRDYVSFKGHITPVQMYRALIENIDGLLIFDDCDSVIKKEEGVNMLKGALDTDPVREVSWNVKGTMGVDTMDPEQRTKVVNAISRILRDEPAEGDLEMFARYVKTKKKEKDEKESSDEDEMDDDVDAFDLEKPPKDGEEEDGRTLLGYDYYELLHDIQQYLIRHLPNKIDFRGRIIFISNLDEDEWPSAIITRAMTANLNFSSAAMLDYIDKIKSNIKTPTLSDEQKQEVMGYLRELYTTGKLRKQVNFRLVQQAFDLRLTSNWKKLISLL